ncbi:hypothetical protein FDW47_01155 [Campylobacter helveticus]|uniref:hypothetical protein n=1 Tax=Campylobacter helveticus TaxID=28898 RepID=UPI001112596E|nr:hypothetical protein [Campylobacter helveticus]TNB56749.1 hypothetical protein FDW47_01155 [Campylobacter helveticus]
MKILSFLLLLCVSLWAETSVFDGQQKVISKELYQNIAPSDESTNYEKNTYETFVARSTLVLTSEEYAQNFYIGEVFSIELYAKTLEDTEFDFNISLIKNESLNFLNPKSPFEKISNDTYKNTLWFEAKDANANLEEIIVEMLRNEQVFQKASLKINPIRFHSPKKDNIFSHIVASSLEVKQVKTSYFDEKNVIMMLELNATNANLKGFFVNGVQKQGIENYKGDFNVSKAFYYAIFPANKDHFEFSYFNKEDKKLESFDIKIQISDDEISTQSDLNPTNKDFNAYKQYALWALAFILALFFVFKRNYFILAFALLSFALSFLVDTNTHNGLLKANARIKILPTEPSTYFYTTSTQEEVEILGKRENYIKILLRNGKIGWANEVDLLKN